MLFELIEKLEAMPDKKKVIRKGFGYPISWRGMYDELAFVPKQNVTIGEMLEYAKSAVNSTYSGYKGGDFTMGEYTDVHISEQGESDDKVWGYLLDFWGGEN